MTRNYNNDTNRIGNSKGYNIDTIISDIGSGLNYNRVNWNKLIQSILEKRISKIIISHKDRFIRFGYDWYNSFFNKFGCSIEVVNENKQSAEAELVQDLISIIHVFSCRIYIRRYFLLRKKNCKIA